MLSGATGIGKTRWLLGCAKAVLLRESFATFSPDENTDPPPNILYLDYELGMGGMQSILKAMAPFPKNSLSVVCFDDPKLGEDGFHPIDSPDGKRQVLALLKATDSQLLILDNLYSACKDGLLGGTELASAHASLAPFLKDLSRFGVASLCAHHAGRDVTRAYGDSRLTWASTGHLHIEGKDHIKDGEFRVQVKSLKLRYGKSLVPTDMVCDVATGDWAVVGEVQPTTEQSRWLKDSVTASLKQNGSPTPLQPIRDKFFERFCQDCEVGTGRVRWKRAISGCVTYFEFTSEEVGWRRRI